MSDENKVAEGLPPPQAATQSVQPNHPTTATLAQGRQASSIKYRRLSDVQSVPIDWLWPHVIPRGKYSLIAGHPGLGKSQLSLWLAATVSHGGVWPASTSTAHMGNILILSAEDDAADTIKPRLEAVGADVSKVYIIDAVTIENEGERLFNLKEDIDRLAVMIEEIGDVALIIIDPISSYTSGADNHKEAEVRQLLAHLVGLAEKHKVAIIGIAHLNKGEGKEAITRVTGSMAFTGVARASWYVAKDNNDPERRIFAAAKNNLGVDNIAYAFKVHPKTLASGIETSCIEWEKATLTGNADIFMAPDNPSIVADAENFLKNLLANGELPAKIVYKEADDAGFSEQSITRAKKRIGIRSKKLRDKWVWSLPAARGSRSSTCSTTDIEDVAIKHLTGDLLEHVPAKHDAPRKDSVFSRATSHEYTPPQDEQLEHLDDE